MGKKISGLFKQILQSNKKNFLLIFVNYNKKLIDELKNIHCIEDFYINNKKGYSICCLKNDKV